MVDETNTNSEDFLRDLTIDDAASTPDLLTPAPDNSPVAEVEPFESLPTEGPDNLDLPQDPLLELTPDQEATQVATDFELGMQQDMLKATDDLASAKDNFFDADLYKYDRYAGYGKGILDAVGFNPYLDNEANFNASTGIIDDWFRAQAPTFDNMLLGFVSSLPGGTTDVASPEHAKRMAKNSEIAHSDRGGIGSFGINLYHNAGFTIGIMAEMAAEELVMTGVTALTAGATGGVQGARTAYLATKLGRALSGGLKIANKLDNLKDVSKARSFFNKAVNFINPLEEVTKLKNASNKLDGLGKLAVTSKYFGAFYRDTRNLRMAFSESSLEGGMVRNSKREEYLQDWYSKNPGGKISDEELADIDKLAMDAGRTASFINMPTIFFSNKLVFDNMFKSFSPAGRLMDNVVETGVRGEVSFAKKTAKQIAKGEKAYEKVASGFQRRLNNIKNPADWLKRSGTYFKANFAEGLQEIAQETIASGVEEHYQNIYEGDALKGGLLVSLANGLQKQASAQGLETFASGFLMGGMVQPVTMIPGKVRKHYKRVTAKGRKEYAAQQKARDEYIDKTVEKLNDIYENNPSYFMNDLNDLVTQAKHARNINKANKTGDKKLFKDIQERGNFDAITTALKMGRLNSFKEQLNTYREYSEAEIKEEFGMSKSDFLLGLDQAQQRMDKIQARYDLVQKEFLNPYNASKYKNNSNEQREELQKQLSWEHAQKELVFNGHAFDRSLERMTSIMSTAKDTAGLGNMSAADFNTLFTSQDLDGTISTLQDTIDSYGDVSEPEAKKNKAKDQAKLDSLTDFRNKFEAFLDNVGLSKKEKPKVSAEEGAVAVKGKVKTDEQLYTEAYDSFKSYIELMSKSTGDFVFNNKLEEAFEGIVDYQRLDADAKKLSTSINILMKASNFEGLAERLNNQLKDQANNRKFEMEKALKAWLKEVKDPSDLVNALDKAGIFLDPQYLKAIMGDGMSANDVQFYNLKTKELILPTDEIYAEAIKIIFDKGGLLTDINIAESEVPNSEVGYRLRNRIKDPADTRTYDQIATEYGFDSAADSTTLSLKDVLNKIINNNFVSQEEIELAKQLLKLAKDGETITFVKNASQPGVFSEENQSVIDARYSSSEYDNGYLPFESSILHTEINRRVDESFDEDLEFRTAINEQWAAAKEAAVDSEEFPNIKTLVGSIKNAKEFMALAMTNAQFQLFLSTIESPVTKTSQWKNFVDNVMKMFTDYFKLKGIEPTRTVLNTTIELITTKVDPVVYSGTGGTVSPMAPVTAESEVIPGDHDDVYDVAKKKAKGQDITKEEEELVAKYPVLYAKLVKVEQDRIEALEKARTERETGEYKPSQNQKNFETIQERLDKGDNIEGAILSPSEVRDEATANKHADTTMYVQIEGAGPLKVYFPGGAPESGAKASLSLKLPVAGEENVIEDEDGNLVFQYQADGPMFPAVIEITTADGKTGQLAYTNFSTEAAEDVPDFADINQEFDKKAQDIINSIPKRSDTSSGKPTYTLNSILNDLGSVKSTHFLRFIYDRILMESSDDYKSLKTIQTKEGEMVDLSAEEFLLQVEEKNPKYVGPESPLSKLILDSYSKSGLSTILDQMNIEAAKQAADTASGTTPINVFNTYENKINTTTLSVEGLEKLKENIREEDNLTPEEQNLLIEQISKKIEDLKNSNIPTETELRNLAVGTVIAISTPKTGNQFVIATVIETKPNSFIAETYEGKVKHTIKFSEVNKVNLNHMDPYDSSVMKDTEEDSDNSVGDIDETVIEDAIKRASDDTDATNQDLDEGLADYLNDC
jgi:hypothetical protein